MTYHPSSPVSIAIVLTAATVLVLGYHFGRTHAAWRDVHDAKRAVVVNRRHAWRHTARLVMGTAALLVTLAAAAYDVGH
jgi:hypothetical protein